MQVPRMLSLSVVGWRSGARKLGVPEPDSEGTGAKRGAGKSSSFLVSFPQTAMIWKKQREPALQQSLEGSGQPATLRTICCTDSALVLVLPPLGSHLHPQALSSGQMSAFRGEKAPTITAKISNYRAAVAMLKPVGCDFFRTPKSTASSPYLY